MNIFSVQFFGYCLVYLDLSFLLLDRNKLGLDDENDESNDEEFKILQAVPRTYTYHLKIKKGDLPREHRT